MDLWYPDCFRIAENLGECSETETATLLSRSIATTRSPNRLLTHKDLFYAGMFHTSRKSPQWQTVVRKYLFTR